MNKLEYIFFDFNGTIIDDMNLCLGLLNDLLKTQNKGPLSMNEYTHVFTFPIKEYYRRTGLDFNIESYESMANRFINRYINGFKDCDLYPNTKETLLYLKNKGIKLICLSATEIGMLKKQLNYFGIIDLFDDILGISDIYAKSKEDIAVKYIEDSKIDKNSAILVGDTLHDLECANKMGIEAILTYTGHQAIDVIEKGNTTIIKNISILKELL